ncbi:hypothetical protein V5799_032561 [Amblyomma americanum]|uniref:Peptidase M13 N-terminal domain-containing protein n=1 Tax=Amblyomma americanum TaxID=6943 RepID=A0AAQ4DQU0_AMBAM
MATNMAMDDRSWLDNDGSIPSPAPSEARQVLWKVLLRRSPIITRRLWVCCGCCALVAVAVFVAAVATAVVRGSSAPSGLRRTGQEGRGLLFALEATRCKSVACQRYARELSDSLDLKRQPCEDLYGFVCGRWPQQGGSVRSRAAFDAKAQALASALSNQEDGQVGALVRACLRRDVYRNGLEQLEQFLAERGLPWPRTLTRPLLEVLIDLSANWNLHLWFRVDITAGENQRPTVQFRQSPELVQWIDEQHMRQGTDYDRWMSKALVIFGKPSHNSNASMILLIKAMDNLITHLMGAALQQWQPPVVTSVGNLSLYAPLVATTDSWLDVLDRSLVLPEGSALSGRDTVQLFDRDVLQTSLYLIGLDSETEAHLALSVGLRVIEILGWMVETSLEEPHGAADGWRTPRCLSQVQRLVGPAWHDLLLMPHHDGGIVEAVRSVLQRARPPRLVPSGGADIAFESS